MPGVGEVFNRILTQTDAGQACLVERSAVCPAQATTFGGDCAGNHPTDFEKNKVKPWQLKSWCQAEVTPEFLARLKDILELYARPYDPQRPTVCFDELNVQLLGDRRCGLPLRPGYAQRQDYEYIRHGTRNLFIFVEPKAGQRHLLITRRRTKEDWAQAIRYVVDA